MKKVIIVFAELLIFVSINAMDCTFTRAEKKEDLLAVLSFKSVDKAITLLSCDSKKSIERALLKSKIFTVALFPQEIRYEIFKKILNDDEESARQFDEMPIIDAYQLYHELQHIAPLMIGGVVIPGGRLFRLPTKIRKDLIAIGNPSIYEGIMGQTSSIITREKYEKIMCEIPIDIQQKIICTLKILDEKKQFRSFRYRLAHISTVLLGIIVLYCTKYSRRILISKNRLIVFLMLTIFGNF